MKIKRIIEIDEDKYKSLITMPNVYASEVCEVIRQSKPYNDTGDCISRSALIKAFKEECCGNCHLCERYAVFENGIHHCGLINNAPTVEESEIWEGGFADGLAAGAKWSERQKGEWIELPKAFDSRELPCKCSACGHILSFMNYYPKSKFCPNCGADMRGSKE